MDDGADLLRLEVATFWSTDDRGRLERSRTPDRRPAPLLAVATSGDALIWACSTAVPDQVVATIDDVLSTTAANPDVALEWQPDSAGALLEALAPLDTSPRVERGPSYVVARVPSAPEGVEWWWGGDADRERLAGIMPEEDRELPEPWAVVVVDGRVASVCETARSTATSVEAGVWTYGAYRRRGLGTAVTAAWSALVADRTTFYSTSFDNLGSQGIARRLGMRLLGQWWQVHAG